MKVAACRFELMGAVLEILVWLQRYFEKLNEIADAEAERHLCGTSVFLSFLCSVLLDSGFRAIEWKEEAGLD